MKVPNLKNIIQNKYYKYTNLKFKKINNKSID